MRWLKKDGGSLVSPDQTALLAHLDDPNWVREPARVADMRAVLEPLAAYYFVEARAKNGRVVDPVARFHLGNGARLERLDWLGDRSQKGLRESAGLMVNYLYDLDKIEENHEAYANLGEVVAASAIKKLARTPKPRPPAIPALTSNG